MKKYAAEELATVLSGHLKWLESFGASGTRADLCSADLRHAYLRHANLRGADLSDASLRGADLRGASLRDADLSDASLRGADLRGASLRDADLRDADLSDASLCGADLRGASLCGADLRGADLRGSDLRDANLRGANLRGATNAKLALAMCTFLPSGSIHGWKKCRDGVLVQLLIPEDAKRSHGASRKCRAERAFVLDVIGSDVGISQHDSGFEYRVGACVEPREPFCEDRWDECASGIHFFITREEAEAY